MTGRLSLYAVTAPGLELHTAAELACIGITPTETEPGGVAFEGTLDDVARANLWLRTASRVLVRLGSFHARALGELERKAAALPWRDWLPAGTAVSVRVTCRKSRLYHQKAVAERIVTASAGVAATAAGDPDEVEETEGQLIVVRLFRDACSISLDSSGALLHRRGYRLAVAKAPLRETLAAGLLLESGWSHEMPLIDPFCGSGTIPIEAAMLARRIPPGLARSFAFLRWPGADLGRWGALLDSARAAILPHAAAPILGSDRDAGAIEAATANALRAGVAEDITWRQAAVSSLEPPAGIGALVSNPPYGMRVSEGRELRDLFARLGTVARERLPGWRVSLLLPEAPLERATGLPFGPALHTRNGGLAVRMLTAVVEGSSGGAERTRSARR
ncbi:MAG: class I SAM-dependent RNA methyltransferase [Gemmatimonadota bacterium]